MSETVIKSSIPGVRDLLIAQASGCVVLSKVVDGKPMTSTLIAVANEDLPALVKALQEILHEKQEVESI
ncbi:hypothetical protein [Rhizobium leguminosarum]